MQEDTLSLTHTHTASLNEQNHLIISHTWNHFVKESIPLNSHEKNWIPVFIFIYVESFMRQNKQAETCEVVNRLL